MKKTVTLSNIEIVKAVNALSILCQQERALNPQFVLTKNKKALEQHATDYQDFHIGILNEFAEKDENGNIKQEDKEIKDEAGVVVSVVKNVVVFPTPEAGASAKAKVLELEQLPVEVEYRSVAINSMTAQGVDQSVLEALLWMFEEPE